MLDVKLNLDPNRPLLGALRRSGTAPVTGVAAGTAPIDGVAVTPAASRLTEQKRYMAAMWSQLGKDARLAAVMFNPIFMIQAQAVTNAAVARAVKRYETELPRKDFSVLYGEEMTKAQAAILAMPARYERYGAQALEATGQALLEAYDTTTEAVTTAAVATGRVTRQGVMAVVGVFVDAGSALVHGVGHLLHGLGSALTGAGGRLERVGY